MKKCTKLSISISLFTEGGYLLILRDMLQEKDLKKILELFEDTDPLLKRQIYSEAKRYESLDDLIVDYEDMINDQRRKQKLIDMYFGD